jgi:hypothetical protein
LIGAEEAQMKDEAEHKDAHDTKAAAAGEQAAQMGRQSLSNEAFGDAMKAAQASGGKNLNDASMNIQKDAASNHALDQFKQILNPEKFRIGPPEGVQTLSTGDHIVREDGKQTYYGENGGKITINPDGSHTVQGDISKETTDKNGRTTVEFGDGSKVTFDKDGFREVERNDQGVILDRCGNEVGGFARAHKIPPDIIKGDPFPFHPTDPPIIMYDYEHKP